VFLIHFDRCWFSVSCVFYIQLPYCFSQRAFFTLLISHNLISAKAISSEEYFKPLPSISTPFTPTKAAAPPQSTPAATTKEKTTTPTRTTQTTGSNMKTSVVAINLENPEDNDHFYA
jgi:hypothetical protein